MPSPLWSFMQYEFMAPIFMMACHDLLHAIFFLCSMKFSEAWVIVSANDNQNSLCCALWSLNLHLHFTHVGIWEGLSATLGFLGFSVKIGRVLWTEQSLQANTEELSSSLFYPQVVEMLQKWLVDNTYNKPWSWIMCKLSPTVGSYKWPFATILVALIC
jgi:hypothetical protein